MSKRQDPKAPGSRGGKFRVTRSGHVKYGGDLLVGRSMRRRKENLIADIMRMDPSENAKGQEASLRRFTMLELEDVHRSVSERHAAKPPRLYGETPDGGYVSAHPNREHGGWMVELWTADARRRGGAAPAYKPARDEADAAAIVAQHTAAKQPARWKGEDPESRHERVFAAAKQHAQTCRRCYMPIIKDDEGNPGLHGEACPEGRKLLDQFHASEAALLEHYRRSRG